MIKIAAGFEMTTDEPYLCTDWKETKFCSDPCKEEGTMLETRECVTTQPGLLLSELEHPPVLIRAGSTSCGTPGQCLGSQIQLYDELTIESISQVSMDLGQIGLNARAIAGLRREKETGREVATLMELMESCLKRNSGWTVKSPVH